MAPQPNINRSIPRPGTRTRRVWEIADTVTRESGRRAQRRDVIERYVAEGGNPNTANTQYQYWKSDYESRHGSSDHPQREEASDVGAQTLKVASDGRLVIPLEMRTAMDLGDDGRVIARVVKGELRLMSRTAAIKRMQDEARAHKKPGERVVDEFLAERRAMWNDA